MEVLERRLLLSATATPLSSALSVSDTPGTFVRAGNMGYFVASTPETGAELWRSDGTPEGTILLKDIAPGAEGSDPQELTVYVEAVFFTAYDPAHGRELWVTNGTPLGTYRVKDIEPGAGSASPADLVWHGDSVYFTAAGTIWRTKGTDALTYSTGVAAGTQLTSAGFELYFRRGDNELWAVKPFWQPWGATLTPTLLATFTASQPGTVPLDNLFQRHSTLYFSGDDGVHGAELWKSEGGPATTRMVADFYTGSWTTFGGGATYPNSTSPHDFAMNGGLLYFSGWGPDGEEPMVDDGTSIRLLKDLYTGAYVHMGVTFTGSSAPSAFTPVGTKTYFAATGSRQAWETGPDVGRELYVSSGTPESTQLFSDLEPGPASSSPAYLVSHITNVYFTPLQGVHANTLWRTERVAPWATPVKGLPAGQPARARLALADGVLVTVFDGVGQRLWFAMPDELGVIGHVDLMTSGRVMGWAFDTAWPDSLVRVRLLANNMSIADVYATGSRDDLAAAMGSDGKHAFDFFVQHLKPGEYVFTVEAEGPQARTTVLASRKIRVASALFDEAMYQVHNPDVTVAISQGQIEDGVAHYYAFGAREGRSASPLFDEAYYLDRYPDVAAAVNSGLFVSGFDHFDQAGHREGRRPSLWFNSNMYLAANSDVGPAIANGQVGSAFEHYILYGQYTKRPVLPYFDDAFYWDQYPQVYATPYRSAYMFYLSAGIPVGHRPSALFDPDVYLAANPDVAAAVASGAVLSAFAHFLSFGIREDRHGVPGYSEAAYLAKYADVADAVTKGLFDSGLGHYLLIGKNNGYVLP